MENDNNNIETNDTNVYAVRISNLNLWYGTFQALFDVNLNIKKSVITALIGPSGCGKSTLIRSVNRINERLGYVRIEGNIDVHGHNIYAPEVELVQVRKEIGMVFQRPNPLPLSVRENVMFGHNIHFREKRSSRAENEQILEESLRTVLLWNKVKDHLNRKATELSLEEQQKLCIARLLPVKPMVLLMDEPCSALDPQGTEAIEELIWELRRLYTIIIVTHNMAQARRTSEECVFMLMGKVIEHSATGDLFVSPQQQETANYIEGRYG